MNSPDEDNNPADEAILDNLLDIPPEFRPVAAKYSREMFALVLNSGLAQVAAERLAALVDKHRSQHGAHAVGVLSDAFNAVSNAYCKEKGWEQGILAQCDRDIQLAAAGKVQAPGSVLRLDS